MKIVLAIFITLITLPKSQSQELSLEELHKDMEMTSKHFSYGREISEDNVIENTNEPESNLADLESRYFDSVSTGAAGINKRQRLR